MIEPQNRKWIHGDSEQEFVASNTSLSLKRIIDPQIGKLLDLKVEEEKNNLEEEVAEGPEALQVQALQGYAGEA